MRVEIEHSSSVAIPLPGSPDLSILIKSGSPPPRFTPNRDRDFMALFLHVLEENAIAMGHRGRRAVLPLTAEWAAPGGFILDLFWEHDSYRKFYYAEAMQMAYQLGLWARTANVIGFKFIIRYKHKVELGYGEAMWRG